MQRNNPYKIDTFWEVFHSSRCKTAMLVISVIVTIGLVIAEILGTPNPTLHQGFIIIMGYWMGRTSKSKENIRYEGIVYE